MQPTKFVMCASSKTLLDSAAGEVLLNPTVAFCTQIKCASNRTIPPCVCLGNAFSEISSFKSLHDHVLSTSLNIHALYFPEHQITNFHQPAVVYRLPDMHRSFSKSPMQVIAKNAVALEET
jgi:hypothetical protein